MEDCIEHRKAKHWDEFGACVIDEAVIIKEFSIKWASPRKKLSKASKVAIGIGTTITFAAAGSAIAVVAAPALAGGTIVAASASTIKCIAFAASAK